jgi:hypothetical protein
MHHGTLLDIELHEQMGPEFPYLPSNSRETQITNSSVSVCMRAQRTLAQTATIMIRIRGVPSSNLGKPAVLAEFS